MKNSIEYVPINISHTREAVNLVMADYDKERKRLSILPEADFSNNLYSLINELFEKGSGIAALVNGSLVGFLAGLKVNEFFGKNAGIYCPIYGHGALDAYDNLYFNLYEKAAAIWTKNSYTTHAVTLYAQDEALVNRWFWMGFGLRCVDAVRNAASFNIQNKSIQIRKSKLEDGEKLSKIHTEHNLYYRKSPLFMPNKAVDPIKEYCIWLGEENHHEWVAYKEDKPVGIMRLEPYGENYISCHPSFMNIKHTFVVEEGRRSGIGLALLDSVQRWLVENKYQLCGVDFEAFNPLGKSFWMKYFTPYTYSVVRRIDERIVDM